MPSVQVSSALKDAVRPFPVPPPCKGQINVYDSRILAAALRFRDSKGSNIFFCQQIPGCRDIASSCPVRCPVISHLNGQKPDTNQSITRRKPNRNQYLQQPPTLENILRVFMVGESGSACPTLSIKKQARAKIAQIRHFSISTINYAHLWKKWLKSAKNPNKGQNTPSFPHTRTETLTNPLSFYCRFPVVFPLSDLAVFLPFCCSDYTPFTSLLPRPNLAVIRAPNLSL